MALDFPSTPTDGHVYDNFYYDSAKGTWKSLSSGVSPSILVNPTITDGVITATATNSTTVPLTVKGAASQSANLQEFKNSSGTVLSSVNASGNISTPVISTSTSAYLKDVHIDRDNSSLEGGQINFRRSIDNVDYWFIDVYGSTSTPSLRFFNASQPTPAMVMDPSNIISTPYQPTYGGYFSAYQAGNTSNYYPVLNNNFIVGITKSGNNRLTVPTAGKYYVSAQQLVNTGAVIAYFRIDKNGSTVAYAYSNNDDTYDVMVNVIVDMAANDYIEFYYQGTTAYSWSSPHSYVSMFKVS